MSSHRLFETGIKRVGGKEKGFSYVYPDSGERVREEKVLERVESLKISPAYRDVRVARGPSAKVQAVSYDSAGRLQYVYNPKYREKKEREKLERMLRFANALPTMRQVTSGHLRRKKLDRGKVLACMPGS